MTVVVEAFFKPIYMSNTCGEITDQVDSLNLITINVTRYEFSGSADITVITDDCARAEDITPFGIVIDTQTADASSDASLTNYSLDPDGANFTIEIAEPSPAGDLFNTSANNVVLLEILFEAVGDFGVAQVPVKLWSTYNGV